jgi:hypothetical protein
MFIIIRDLPKHYSLYRGFFIPRAGEIALAAL